MLKFNKLTVPFKTFFHLSCGHAIGLIGGHILHDRLGHYIYMMYMIGGPEKMSSDHVVFQVTVQPETSKPQILQWKRDKPRANYDSRGNRATEKKGY